MLSVMSMMEGGHLHEEEEEEEEEDPHLEEEEHGHDGLQLSKAELRKSNKPIMEKRRRARINTCLNELKTLILDAMRKDPARHSKLEKADILEMTVKHLQAVQRQQLAMAVAHDPAVLTKFRSGFTECAQEVTRYVSRIEVEGGVRQRLLQHLGQCVSGLSTMTPMSFTAMAGLPMPLTHLQGGALPPGPPPPLQQRPGDVNNNQARLLHGLVAARLAAAGDAAGAALLLHGGLSLLAHASPHPPPPTSQPGAPPPQGTNTVSSPQPSQVLQPAAVKVNDGASSSGERPPRPSAFTAVRRAGSPPRAPLEVYTRPQDSASSGTTQKVLAPTARRYIGLPEPHAETVVRAQVAVQPVNLALSAPRDTDARAPLDFSFRKPPLNRLVPPHSTAPAQPQHTGTAPPQHTTPSQTATHKDVPHLPSPKYVPALALCTSFRQSQTEGSSQQKPDIITIKRPLEEQDTTCTRPSKIAKTDYSPSPGPPPLSLHLTPPSQPTDASHTSPPLHDSPPSQRTPPSHLTPPSHTTPPSHMGSSLHLTPPSHTTPSMHLTPPSTTSPQSQVSSGVSPGSHASPGPSPTSQTTPRKVKSEGSPSPDRPSTSATQEDKDMWRPW
ncbi:hypothetical protein O3P69_004390 [Scylla paramamosain]|uniref:Uncharacterized protein n=1 Tax=Scylla paramamosain TaxID=85552 RepID=A0AAW0UE53_SCYPA